MTKNLILQLKRLCSEKGLRFTEQREAIANIISQATDHPSVEEVYRRVSAIDPKINISTVYRTLKLLEEEGILEKHEFADGKTRYEPSDVHHDHLINLETGTVIEFHNDRLEKLQRDIAKELGYELVSHRLELYGVPIEPTKE